MMRLRRWPTMSIVDASSPHSVASPPSSPSVDLLFFLAPYWFLFVFYCDSASMTVFDRRREQQRTRHEATADHIRRRPNAAWPKQSSQTRLSSAERPWITDISLYLIYFFYMMRSGARGSLRRPILRDLMTPEGHSGIISSLHARLAFQVSAVSF